MDGWTAPSRFTFLNPLNCWGALQQQQHTHSDDDSRRNHSLLLWLWHFVRVTHLFSALLCAGWLADWRWGLVGLIAHTK